MTRHALLMSIGATAVAFAVAIGVAAGSPNGVNTSQSSRIAFAASAADDRGRVHEWSVGTSPEGDRLVAGDDPCLIAI